MAAGALNIYNKKRNFAETSEPKGTVFSKRRSKLIFVVQKHVATRLHYDFRLELGGVLLSWAVPKGPSLNPKDKRLAARTEDHPLSYHDFEGIIPAKQYGAGPVMVWDAGTWIPLDKEPQKALKNGKLSFRLEGEKLSGEWTLARMRTGKDKRENWLLIKHKDDAANNNAADFLLETDYSVKSGKAFDEIAQYKKTAPSKKRKKKQNSVSFNDLEKIYKTVQLATLVDKPPHSKEWAHEVKYDGYRLLCFLNQGDVKIHTRNGHDWTHKFPHIANALKSISDEIAVLDGEAVVLDDKGLSDFKSLQNALDDEDTRIQIYFFDLLHWKGKNYADKGFSVRRKALEKFFEAIPDDPVLFLSETIEGDSEKIIEQACHMGLEGLISKKLSAPYIQGRSKYWLKSKCVTRQEFVICGFIPASDEPKAVGALHLGYYKDEKLTYAGKVGTGFDHKTAKSLFKNLSALKVSTHPFGKKPEGSFSGTLWVKPDLLCEVKFAMWTKSGKIRHASYQGLRADKPASQITKEKPVPTKKVISKKGKDVGGVAISHPDRAIFPKAGITKSDLAEFYHEMSPWIMPDIQKRPISVVRCPGGIDKACFFQRSKGEGMPEHIENVDIGHDSKKHDYMYVKNESGLVELVQMGGIEIHPWGVRIDNTDKPDRLVFDLDPADDVPFEAVKLAAQDIRKRMKALGLECNLKVTGGKGLHVVVPIKRQHSWNTIKEFTRNFAQRMVDDVPDAYTINMAKAKRKGRIFIDYLRNDFASTAVMDYCVRARPGGPVAVPIQWSELKTLKSAAEFTIKDVLKRKKAGKLVKGTPKPQALTKTIIDKIS